MDIYEEYFPVGCPYCDSEDYEDTSGYSAVDDGEKRILRCSDCGKLYEASFYIELDCNCSKLKDIDQEKLQKEYRLATYRAELAKMGQQEFLFD